MYCGIGDTLMNACVPRWYYMLVEVTVVESDAQLKENSYKLAYTFWTKILGIGGHILYSC